MTDTRRAKRIPLQCEIEFRRAGETRSMVDLLDLSPNGCCIAPTVRVEPGQTIFLRMPGMEGIQAKVAWVEQWKVGVEFERPMYGPVFDGLVARLKR
jgi:hypothetical protein